MAVARFTGAWSDSTEQTVLSARCKVTSIVIHLNYAQSANVYVQLFDATNPTPGVTVPEVQVKARALATDGKKIAKFIFPGGILFSTACTAFCSTAGAGATAPLTTVLPDAIDVFYTIGN